jgi:hypothetical protein
LAKEAEKYVVQSLQTKHLGVVAKHHVAAVSLLVINSIDVLPKAKASVPSMRSHMTGEFSRQPKI